MADTLRSVHLCAISNPISESTFGYLANHRYKKYFDQLTSSLELADMFKTYLTTAVVLSVCYSVGLYSDV
ncbi:MAG: hypothetical protein P4M11_08735 [Candidatus Pacebacteria bacterium]|nr:hypothetical protein [Candidatus Paceibacterota bacterium]